jgi:FPC/CPF motif-containing protein YcgG
VAPQLGNLGYGAVVMGFCAMFAATAYFLVAATHSHSKASRIYHYITLVVTFCL